MSIYDSGPFAPHERVTPKQLLVSAKALIEDPTRWIKHSSIREVDGHECFCSSGALERAAIVAGVSRYSSTRQNAAQALQNASPGPFKNFVVFNDHFTTEHEDVMAMFDRAIASF
jgi:hypothetical protein